MKIWKYFHFTSKNNREKKFKNKKFEKIVYSRPQNDQYCFFLPGQKKTFVLLYIFSFKKINEEIPPWPRAKKC